MYSHRKTKSCKLEENKTRESKKCYKSKEIWSEIENRFIAKLNGNVCKILEKIVVRFAE